MAAENAPTSSSKPIILLVSLDYDQFPWFDEMYNRLLAKLSDRARVLRAKTKRAALKPFNANNADHPIAVFVNNADMR
jgi:hypothetical protein